MTHSWMMQLEPSSVTPAILLAVILYADSTGETRASRSVDQCRIRCRVVERQLLDTECSTACVAMARASLDHHAVP